MTESNLKIEPAASADEAKSPLVPKAEDPKPSEEKKSPAAAAESKDDTAKPRTRTITTTLRDTWWRFLFLGFCCLVLVGSYYCYDNPAPMERKLKAVCSLSDAYPDIAC